MYYTGLDPRDMSEVYVPRSAHEKAMQRALLQYTVPANHKLVVEALKAAGREDLIGYGRGCLVKPYAPRRAENKRPDGGRGPKPRPSRGKGGRR